MSSGQVTLSTQSVDYGGGRGTRSITNVINWNVDANGNISFSQASVSGNTWWICGTASWYGVHLVPQVSYDGVNWVDLADMFHSVEICPGSTDTKAMSSTLIGQLGTYHLNGDCSLRFLYYANAAPAPTPDLPNAFPDSGYSAAVQVPVHVEVSWTATLNYDANGGSGAPAAQTASESGTAHSFTVSSTIPTRSNYRFEGWSHGGNTYHAGDTFTIQKSAPTQTLTAIWTEFYRPGERKVSGTWMSHNRSGGACERKVSGSWTEMRTIDGGVGTNDPPSRKQSGTWYNMRKVGN